MYQLKCSELSDHGLNFLSEMIRREKTTSGDWKRSVLTLSISVMKISVMRVGGQWQEHMGVVRRVATSIAGES